MPAQDLNFRHFGVDEGLPSSQVHDIFQDKYGCLWFSTDRGLSRYDGYTFKTFTTADGLTDNTVFKFHPQPDGTTWCTTHNKSVFYFSGEQPVFKPYKYNATLTGLSELFVPQGMHVTADRQLYIGFVNATGYLHLDADGRKRADVSRNTTAKNSSVNLMFRENNGAFFFLRPKTQPPPADPYWSGQRNSPFNCMGFDFVRACYLEKARAAVFINPGTMHILQTGHDTLHFRNTYEPISLGQLNDSLFWVGYRYGGVSVFNLNGKLKSRFLAGKSVTRLFVDHENGYWISTLNDGVYHARTTQVVRFTQAGNDNDWINSITSDNTGNIWLGYYNGNVDVLIRDSLQPVYRSQIKKPALVARDFSGGMIYAASDLSLFQSNKPARRHLNYNPTCIYAFAADSIWMGGYANINIVDPQNNQIIKTGFRVNAVMYYNDQLYAGSNKGLYAMRNVHAPEFKPLSGFAGTGISDLRLFGNELAVATKGQGIIFYNGITTKSITEKDGLNSNIINAIYPENDTVLWACTNAGLNRIAKSRNGTFTIHTIGREQGLISNEVTGITIHHDTVWVGTRQGLCYFPANITRTIPPRRDYYLALHRFSINDTETMLTDGDHLPYNKNRIEFRYAAISFSGTPVLYRYKLEGLHNYWSYTTSLRTLYSSLPPGTYTFIVQVKGSNASWELQEQRIGFTICPPFWKTWWFIAGIIAAAVLLVYLFFRYRILSYNRDITRELLRQLLKRFTRKTGHVVFREQGKDIRIPSHSICFVKADGNYIEIHTDAKKYLVRFKIGEFPGIVPDPLEYLRISRSYIIRLDKVQEKSRKDVTVKGEKIPVGETYLDELKKIRF